MEKLSIALPRIGCWHPLNPVAILHGTYSAKYIILNWEGLEQFKKQWTLTKGWLLYEGYYNEKVFNACTKNIMKTMRQ